MESEPVEAIVDHARGRQDPLPHAADEPLLPDEGEEDISTLETNIIQQSHSIDDFTRIIAEWRTEREKGNTGNATTAAGPSSLSTSVAGGAGSLRVRGSVASLSTANLRAADAGGGLASSSRATLDVDAASQYSYDPSSVGEDVEDERQGLSGSPARGFAQSTLEESTSGATLPAKLRCTCCCGRGTRRCRRARKANREWSQVESDLHLAAQIGQALLRRSDALQSELATKDEEHGSRLNSLMKKLTSSIREASQLEKRLEQSDLNLEAADASSRALVRELDDTRKELNKARSMQVRASTTEQRLQRAEMELQDLRQELAAERKETESAKTVLKRAEKVNTELAHDLRLAKAQRSSASLTEAERAKRREDVRKMLEDKLAQRGTLPSGDDVSTADMEWINTLVSEHSALQESAAEMTRLLHDRNEEIAHLREEAEQRHERVADLKAAPQSKPSGEEDAKDNILRPHESGITPTVLSDELICHINGSDEPQQDAALPRVSPRLSTGSENQTVGFLSPRSISSALPSNRSASASSTMTSDATSDTASQPDNQGGRTTSSQSTAAKRETRTAQLTALIDFVQRLSSRLSAADVDTLARRLQRQKLTGDVGHLARTTVNGILRDADGLRDHFRRAVDSEFKGRDADVVSLGSRTSAKSDRLAESESLVTRKELFALIKVFKEIIVEMARLRNAVNEVSLQPQHASRILQEQLGLLSNEDKGMGAWIGRFFSASGGPTTSGPTTQVTAAPSGATQSSLSSFGINAGGGASSGASSRPTNGERRTSAPMSGPSRAPAAVLPTAVAIEVKGMHAAEASNESESTNQSPNIDSGSGAMPSPDLPSHARPQAARRQASLSRMQSRNLSGLFIGSTSGIDTASSGTGGLRFPAQENKAIPGAGVATSVRPNHRLSRIVDDDEVSIHHNMTPRARTLRPRNLSDSSMHTTFLNDAEDESDDEKGETVASLRSGDGVVGGGRGARSFGLPASTPASAAISRVITPSALSLQSGGEARGRSQASIARREESVSGMGLLSGLAQSRPVAKAFGYLSGGSGGNVTQGTSSVETGFHSTPTGTTAAESGSAAAAVPSVIRRAPSALRSKSSKANLSIAAPSSDTASGLSRSGGS